MKYKVAPKDIPKEWRDRCSGDGHKKYIDSDGIRRYVNNNELVSESPYRPCAKCGEFPTDDGDDYCIANLGRVMNACCGHGTNKGYIQFDDGITIRGFFEIEKDKILDEDKKQNEMPFIANAAGGNSTIIGDGTWVCGMSTDIKELLYAKLTNKKFEKEDDCD